MRRTIKRSAPRVIRAFYVNAFLHYSPFPFSFPIASSYISNAALKSLFQASIVWYFMLTFQSGLNCKFLGVLLYYINYLITVHLRVYSVCTFVRQLLTRLQLPKISGRYFPLNWRYCNGKRIKRVAQKQLLTKLPSWQSGVSFQRICAIISTVPFFSLECLKLRLLLVSEAKGHIWEIRKSSVKSLELLEDI